MKAHFEVPVRSSKDEFELKGGGPDTLQHLGLKLPTLLEPERLQLSNGT